MKNNKKTKMKKEKNYKSLKINIGYQKKFKSKKNKLNPILYKKSVLRKYVI